MGHTTPRPSWQNPWAVIWELSRPDLYLKPWFHFQWSHQGSPVRSPQNKVWMAVFPPYGYFSDDTCTHIHNTDDIYNPVIKQAIGFLKGRGEMCVRQPPSLALQTFLIKLVSSLRTLLVPPLKDVWINTPHGLWVWIKLFLCACNILQINTWNKEKCCISVMFPTVFFTVGSFHWCSHKCSYWCVENEHQFAISSGDFLKIRFKTSSTFFWKPSLCKHL